MNLSIQTARIIVFGWFEFIGMVCAAGEVVSFLLDWVRAICNDISSRWGCRGCRGCSLSLHSYQILILMNENYSTVSRQPNIVLTQFLFEWFKNSKTYGAADGIIDDRILLYKILG
jgi:hypothetical protein